MALFSVPGMNFKFFCKKNCGMSLAEVIFSTSILGVILVAMIGTLTTGLESLQKSTGYNQAGIIAQTAVEKYRTVEYSNIVSSTYSKYGFDVISTVIFMK